MTKYIINIVLVAFGLWLIFTDVSVPAWFSITAVALGAFCSGYQTGSVAGLKKGFKEAKASLT